MISKGLLITQNCKFLQHKFSSFSHIDRMMATDAFQGIRSIPVASELVLPETRIRQSHVPAIDRARETAVTYPLYHSSAAGVDIKHRSKSRHLTKLVGSETKP